jgi:hypothetical protein
MWQSKGPRKKGVAAKLLPLPMSQSWCLLLSHGFALDGCGREPIKTMQFLKYGRSWILIT